ncbi:hypothetical protein HDU79_001183 [Rhizoclosmatium sp. JEL0117]|nr:hypothetical protein HDU79_001183 [Rhizoclosmatium sp. JEL0117]
MSSNTTLLEHGAGSRPRSTENVTSVPIPRETPSSSRRQENTEPAFMTLSWLIWLTKNMMENESRLNALEARIERNAVALLGLAATGGVEDAMDTCILLDDVRIRLDCLESRFQANGEAVDMNDEGEDSRQINKL